MPPAVPTGSAAAVPAEAPAPLPVPASSATPADVAPILPYAPSPVLPVAEPARPVVKRPLLLLSGGVIGLAACSLGLLILLLACAGFNFVLRLSVLPLALGAVGFVLALASALVEKSRIQEDTHVLAALFSNSLGIIGGLVEMTVWLGWETMR